MSTLHTLRVRIFNNATGQMLTGYSNYVGFVAVGGAAGSAVPMSEDSNNPGVYFKTNVAGGYYNIYLDIDKSGTFQAGDLKLSGFRHGLAPDDVTTENIEDYSIEVADLAPSVISLINSAGLQPDNLTIGLNGSNQLEVKDGGITTGKYGNLSIPASALQEESVLTDALGEESVTNSKIATETIEGTRLNPAIVDDVTLGITLATKKLYVKQGGIGEEEIAPSSINTFHLVDGDVTTEKLANLSVTGAKIANTTIDGEEKIIPETITGNLLSDEILLPRCFIPDSIEAGLTSPTNFMNTVQFERTGTPIKWQIKQSLLDSLGGTGAPYIVNVLDFGADTSGAGSSSQAFQDAFDAVGEGKGIVVIPPGTYIAKNMTVPGNVTIWAFGAIITMGGTAPTGETSPDSWIIKSAGSSGNENPFIRIEGGDWRGELTTNFTEQSSGNLFDFTFCKSVTITGAILRNSRKHAVSFARCFDCYVNHCSIDKVAGAGVYVAGSTDIFVNQNNVTESAFGVKAITQSADPQRIFVTDNKIEVFATGVFIAFGNGSHVEGNSIFYVEKTGFTSNLYGIIIGSMLFGAAAGSVSSNAMIYGNNINGLFAASIVIEASGFTLRNTMIANNNISGKNGIMATFDFSGDYENVLIKGNLVTNIGSGITFGIYVVANGTFGIQFNQVVGFEYNIRTNNISSTSEGHTIANNRIKSGVYGLFFERTGYSVICDNFIEETTDFAISLTNSANLNFLDRNYLRNCAETVDDGGTGNQITNTVIM